MRKVRENSVAFMFVSSVCPRLARVFILTAAAVAAWPAFAADITVVLDQARLLRLPEKVATIVIGNPMIADASLQPGGLIVLTGKGYGTTNLLVLDRAGAVLMDKTVEVQGPHRDIVVMYRGIERETYSCTPICERRITLGDGIAIFEANIAQTTSRNGLAVGAPPPAK
jgi:hypothetical protein